MIHPITPPMAINLCLLRRADVSLSPMAQKFVDFLCQRLRQQLQGRLTCGYTLTIKVNCAAGVNALT